MKAGTWTGVHTALVTPFSGDNVDLERFRALVRRQLDGGVHGLVVNGTTGESPSVDADEVAALTKVALEEAAGAVPVQVGVGTNNTRSTVANVQKAQALGATAGLLVLPYYNKPNAAGLRAHVTAAAAPGLPLVLYHVPGRTGQRLPPELLAELCAIDGVVASKEATGDLLYGQEFLLATDKPVLSGDDFTWLPLLSVGASGVISVLSNIAPHDTVGVWDAWRSGETDLARARHLRLYPLVRWLFATTSPIPAKAALAAMGLCAPDCRLPLVADVPPPPPALLDGIK
jgi:4-hydroxy-tetrahydrodipicolinate synthase